MNRSELRALVETILTSEDPSLRAGDRLRAAEMLRDLADGPTLDGLIRETTAMLADEELQAWTDSMLAALVLATGDDGVREQWPETARVLDERVAERARALQDQRRAQEARRGDAIPGRNSPAIPQLADRRTAPIASAITVQESPQEPPYPRTRRRRRTRSDTGWHPL